MDEEIAHGGTTAASAGEVEGKAMDEADRAGRNSRTNDSLMEGQRADKQTKEIERSDKCHLLSLPPELRNRIYEAALLEPDRILVTSALREPGFLATCRQIRKEAFKLYHLSNNFGTVIYDYDAALHMKYYFHMSRILKTSFGMAYALQGNPNWANLLAWCRQSFDRCLIFNIPCREEVAYMIGDDATCRAAHRIVKKARSWGECEEELEELRFLVGRYEPAWLR